jgi:hypothetical protein
MPAGDNPSASVTLPRRLGGPTTNPDPRRASDDPLPG